jgi:hypothetical protein
MDYPYPLLTIATPEGTIALGANVQAVINAINADAVAPFGKFGGPHLYWFQPVNNGLGNIIYTVFDKITTLGLASYTVRYGAATTIQQILFEPFPKTEIKLQFIILPNIPGITDPDPTVGGVGPVQQPYNIVPPTTVY